jgi:hypothetical protein
MDSNPTYRALIDQKQSSRANNAQQSKDLTFDSTNLKDLNYSIPTMVNQTDLKQEKDVLNQTNDSGLIKVHESNNSFTEKQLLNKDSSMYEKSNNPSQE